jgi:serpin B
MQNFRFLFFLVFFLVSSLLADEGVNKNEIIKFNKKLYNELKGQEGNIVVSPFSISTALLMAYVGSNSITKEEFESVLGVDQTYLEEIKDKLQDLNSVDSGVKLVTANSFFSDKDYKFLSSYEGELREYFNVEPLSLDFKNETESARLEINKWVEDRTDDLIKELIAEGTLSPLTRAVLVNAIYFNGKWLNKFKKSATVEQEFVTLDGSKIAAPFLRSTFETSYFENDSFQALTLPYEGDRFSMMILLPKDQTKEGFLSLESTFDENLILKIINDSLSTEVQISIPKFKSEYQILLKEHLVNLGLNSAFNEKIADFSRMSKEKGIHISEVIHKAFIEVEEEGTKAAAATAVIMVGRSLAKIPEESKVFKADHPFLYLIRDSKTGLVLFMGRLNSI